MTEIIFDTLIDLGSDLLTHKFSSETQTSSLSRSKPRRHQPLKRKFFGLASHEVDEPAIITEKDERLSEFQPDSSSAASHIVLRMMLGKDGQIRFLQPLRGASNKETRQAIRLAKEIRFQPARRQGVAVSQWLTLYFQTKAT